MADGTTIPDEWINVHVPDVMDWHIKRLDDAGVVFPDDVTSRDDKEAFLYRLLIDQYGTCACGDVGPDLSLITVAFDPVTQSILAWACCDCFKQLDKLRRYAATLRQCQIFDSKGKPSGFAAEDAGTVVSLRRRTRAL